MPIYNFKCDDCKEEFEMVGRYEVIVPVTKACPKCKSMNISRVYESFFLVFKGKGFYKTDNKH